MEPIEVMQQLVGQWGLYPWSPEHQAHHGVHTIHPADLDAWNRLHPYGGLFECVAIDGDYLVLRYGEHSFRVKPELFRKVDKSPAKRIGDAVEVQSKGERVSGVIVEIQWHHQRNEPFYLIERGGKRSSKRYWNCDFL